MAGAAGGSDIEVWAAQFREVLRHHGLASSRELERALAQRVLAQHAELEARQARRRRQVAATARRQGEVCAHLAAGMTRTQAVTAAGVGVETFNRWLRQDEEFARAVRQARRAARDPQQPRRREVRAAKMTDGVRAHLVTLLRAGMTRGQAAGAAGISRQTFYSWLRRVPEFQAAVLAAEDAAALARLADD